MTAIRDKFRKRYLGQLGYAGGESPETMNQPIIRSAADQAENNQTQRDAVYDTPYQTGKKPRRKVRYG